MMEADDNNLPLLYLDIDGVLLRRRHSGVLDGFELAAGCLEFLEWATARFRCRWLSTRCRQGWPDGSRRAFRAAGAPLDDDPRWAAVLNLIEPAEWTVEKTEAIDPASDFWWLDDNPSDHDREWLRVHDREDRLIEVSSDQDPDALLNCRQSQATGLTPSVALRLWPRQGRAYRPRCPEPVSVRK